MKIQDLWEKMTEREKNIALKNSGIETFNKVARRAGMTNHAKVEQFVWLDKDIKKALEGCKSPLTPIDIEKIEIRAARKLAIFKASELEEIEQQKNQKPVKSMTITIEWKKSRTWGANPNASAKIEHHDGTYSYIDDVKCSGCGYDKESTVIAEIFNAVLKYKLYKKIKGEPPYGFYYYGGTYKRDERHREGYLSKPRYNGGVGTSCYYNIAEFLGAKFEHIASGKTFNVYKYTDKK